MANLMFFAAFLYKKMLGADHGTRERLRSFLREIKESGAIPLGMHKNDAGTDAYWWLVYDAGRFASPDALTRHLKERTPPNLTMVILTI